RQTMLFSATLTSRVRGLAMEYMNNPIEIEVAPEQVTVESVTQSVYHVARNEKLSLLLGLLKKENPGSALIFTNMKSTAIRVARQLAHNGFGCEYIIGDLPQKQRLTIINAIKSGTLRILVATDVAARGLHINDLELVVNYDLPADPEAYVHRIGRTARGGKQGKAITLVCERYVYGLEAIESLINMKIPVEWAEEAEYSEDKSAGMRFHEERRERRPERRDNRTGKTRHAERPKYTEKQRHAESPKRAERPRVEREHAARAARGEATERKEKKEDRATKHTRHTEQAVPRVREQRHHDEKKQKIRSTDRKQPLEDRLDFYRKKYGEDFPSSSEPKKRKSPKLMEMIKGIFSRKKPVKKT
ncbi:MAG: helicase-related protein, partial [Proteobacteria bacterium]|nr:helicase-related protein [Pseudomonadota bacterium]